MRARGHAQLLVISLALASATACDDSVTDPAPDARGAQAPPANAVLIAQNDPSIGCTYDRLRGFGFRLVFDWENVEGADHYAVRFKRTESQHAVIDYSVQRTSIDVVFCNSFVIDDNLNNWVLQIAAVALRPDVASVDTLWSEERSYAFRPCRHANRTRCTAPRPPASF